jgi:hypothetical protein
MAAAVAPLLDPAALWGTYKSTVFDCLPAEQRRQLVQGWHTSGQLEQLVGDGWVGGNQG